MISTNKHLPLKPFTATDTEPMTPAEVTNWLNERERRQRDLRRINWLVNFAIGALGVLLAYQAAMLLFGRN